MKDLCIYIERERILEVYIVIIWIYISLCVCVCYFYNIYICVCVYFNIIIYIYVWNVNGLVENDFRLSTKIHKFCQSQSLGCDV